jgi:CheY-like chemotaxis protein
MLEALFDQRGSFVQILPARPEASTLCAAMRLRGLTVLVVEDDVDNLELLSSHVESEGALTLSASSISAALMMSNAHHIDVALCDLELSDGDGCELVSALRRREGLEKLPAVALTGYSDENWRRKASACGFNRYAVKPFPLDVLTQWLFELATPSAP